MQTVPANANRGHYQKIMLCLELSSVWIVTFTSNF
jgi:hypothetical protein